MHDLVLRLSAVAGLTVGAIGVFEFRKNGSWVGVLLVMVGYIASCWILLL